MAKQIRRFLILVFIIQIIGYCFGNAYYIDRAGEGYYYPVQNNGYNAFGDGGVYREVISSQQNSGYDYPKPQVSFDISAAPIVDIKSSIPNEMPLNTINQVTLDDIEAENEPKELDVRLSPQFFRYSNK